MRSRAESCGVVRSRAESCGGGGGVTPSVRRSRAESCGVVRSRAEEVEESLRQCGGGRVVRSRAESCGGRGGVVRSRAESCGVVRSNIRSSSRCDGAFILENEHFCLTLNETVEMC